MKYEMIGVKYYKTILLEIAAPAGLSIPSHRKGTNDILEYL